jgi:hypothetical protein
VDPSKTWIGYMNVFELPSNGSGYDFGSAWATADLDATFSGSTLKLTPNDNIDRTDPVDAYWWQSPNNGTTNSVGNHTMDASMYVQDDTLAGQTVTFSGTCLANTLVSPYTCTVFIKDFAADYSSSTSVTASMAAGAFSITKSTAAGHHIQYGFETVGPNARTAALSSLGNVQVYAVGSTNVLVNPSKAWIGYMNVFELPSNGSGYDFGSAWATADLDATFSGSTLTLTPNDNIDRGDPIDGYWWQSPNDGTTNSVGNHTMDASMYVQDDTLAGKIVTFSGNVWNNSLVSPYTSTVFVKDFASDYSSSTSTTAPCTNGAFSVSLQTTPGDHIQYGFETVGPNARTAALPSLGSVVISSNALPAGPVITGISPATPASVNITSNLTLTATLTGGTAPLTYQWRFNGANLSDGGGISGSHTSALTITNATGAREGLYSLVVKDSVNRYNTNSDYVVVFDPNNLTFDPNASYNGYINAFSDNSGSQGGYEFGFSYPTALLRGFATTTEVYVQPNTQIWTDNSANAFWVNADGTPNQFLEQDYYIQNDSLAGNTLNIGGFCPTNSINSSYTVTVFVTDFSPSYSVNGTVSVPLVANQPFTMTLPTTAGDHIQYGIRVVGLDNASTNSITSGAAYVSVPIPQINVTRGNGVTHLSFLTSGAHSYTVQYKNNLKDSSWTNLNSVSGTGSTVTVNDSTAVSNRFYRLYIQ